MARVTHLVDNSVLARLGKPAVADRFVELRTAGALAITAAAMFELGYSARNGHDHSAVMHRLSALTQLPTPSGDLDRAVEIQSLLAATSRHRGVSLVDALVAATAESRSLTVLHYDSDFELISEVTGQPTEWIVERGTAD